MTNNPGGSVHPFIIKASAVVVVIDSVTHCAWMAVIGSAHLLDGLYGPLSDKVTVVMKQIWDSCDSLHAGALYPRNMGQSL